MDISYQNIHLRKLPTNSTANRADTQGASNHAAVIRCKELYFDLLVTLCLCNLTFKTVSSLCVKHCITST